jgi:hypothetical protein
MGAALVLVLGGAYAVVVKPAWSFFPSRLFVTAPLSNGALLRVGEPTTRFACWIANVNFDASVNGTAQLIGPSGVISSLDFSLGAGEIGGLVASDGGLAYCRIITTKAALIRGALAIEQEGDSGFVTIAATPAFEELLGAFGLPGGSRGP